MSIRRMETPIDDMLPVKYVLVSVFDKSGLEELVPGLVKLNPETVFVSTGGTGKKIVELLPEPQKKNNYISVEDLTGTPEMEGGLVKTLTPGIHARLLGERGNPAHQQYLKEITRPRKSLAFNRSSKEIGYEERPEVGFFDLVVVNLYPFEKVAAKFPKEASFEDVRGNIDIGGPAMLRAAAKNFPNCAVVASPTHYVPIIEEIIEIGGISFGMRKHLAEEVFRTTAKYDLAIADFFGKVDLEKDIKPCYNFKRGE